MSSAFAHVAEKPCSLGPDSRMLFNVCGDVNPHQFVFAVWGLLYHVSWLFMRCDCCAKIFTDLLMCLIKSDSSMMQLSHSPVMLHEACPVVSVWYVLRCHWCASRTWVVRSTTSWPIKMMWLAMTSGMRHWEQSASFTLLRPTLLKALSKWQTCKQAKICFANSQMLSTDGPIHASIEQCACVMSRMSDACLR